MVSEYDTILYIIIIFYQEYSYSKGIIATLDPKELQPFPHRLPIIYHDHWYSRLQVKVIVIPEESISLVRDYNEDSIYRIDMNFVGKSEPLFLPTRQQQIKFFPHLKLI